MSGSTEDGQKAWQVTAPGASSNYRIFLDPEPRCQDQLSLGSKKLNSDTWNVASW